MTKRNMALVARDFQKVMLKNLAKLMQILKLK